MYFTFLRKFSKSHTTLGRCADRAVSLSSTTLQIRVTGPCILHKFHNSEIPVALDAILQRAATSDLIITVIFL